MSIIEFSWQFGSIFMSFAMKNVTCVTRQSKFMESLHLKCLFYYFKTCGLAPLNFNLQAINSAKVHRWTFSCSWKNTVCNLILVLCIAIWSYSTMSDVYYTKKRLGFDDSVYAIVDTYGIVSSICIILIFNLQQTRLSALFNKINSTREIIKVDGSSSSKHNTLLHKIMILMLINGLAWIFLLPTILMYEFEVMLSFVSPTICTYVRNAFILQYCISLKIIEDLFNVLNENLSDLSKYFSSSLEDPSSNTIVIDGELSRLWEWYSLLSKLTQDVADFYSLPMLFIIVCEFLMSIAITYYLSKPIIFGYSELDNLDYANSFAFVFVHVYPVILLATSASAAISKSRQTSEMINDYLKEPKTYMVKDKLLHFAIYLLHHDIEFSVFDLFSLNGSLLVSVTGSVTTYLVILLQFQPPSVPVKSVENNLNATKALS